MSKPKAKQAQQTRKKLLEDNQSLVSMVLKLRDQLNQKNTAEYEERQGFRYGIPDLRSLAELKAYMKDGFFGSNDSDRRKAFMTYRINFAMSEQDLFDELNKIEREIQSEEDENFLLERDYQITKVKKQEEEVKAKLIEESKKQVEEGNQND